MMISLTRGFQLRAPVQHTFGHNHGNSLPKKKLERKSSVKKIPRALVMGVGVSFAFSGAAIGIISDEIRAVIQLNQKPRLSVSSTLADLQKCLDIENTLTYCIRPNLFNTIVNEKVDHESIEHHLYLLNFYASASRVVIGSTVVLTGVLLGWSMN